MQAAIAGVGLLGPGLDGWAGSVAVLSGARPWTRRPVAPPAPAILPATERRRAGLAVRLALAVAAEAAARSNLSPASLRAVFATSNGDGVTVGAVLDAISQPDGFVSPTLFHNSVHNAAAGYWSIAVGSARPASCLGCHDGTFGAALMKALAECEAEREPVLLVVYDAPFPAPLDAVRPTGDAFGVALVLAPRSGSGAFAAAPWIEAIWHSRPAAFTTPRLDCLGANPAARALPLLEMLARREGGSFALPLLDGHLAVSLHP